MRSVKSIAEATRAAGAIVLDSKVRGIHDWNHIAQQMENGDGLSVRWERAFAVGCELYLSFGFGGEVDGYQLRTPKISINWSGTGRDVSTAVASVALYSEVIALAAEIESLLSESVYGRKLK